MNLRSASVFCVLGTLLGVVAACSAPDAGPGASTGGSSSGGTPASGGTGGGTPSTGGLQSTGGTTTGGATGGTTTGGFQSTGGTTGGTTTGGTAAGGTTGGASTGGSAGANTGGSSGGSAGTNSGGANAGQSSGGGASGGKAGGTSTGGSGGGATGGAKFSFFVTSLDAVRSVSGKQNGFGGDLRFGEATGLAGADKICTTIAEKAMPGSGAKGWRAFLSTTTVNAIDRVGSGPWYDRLGRLVAQNVQGLLQTRPAGDMAIINDLPNETGVPNQAGTGTGMDDNHDMITGSNTMGKWDNGPTCNDWTSATGTDGPRVGHSWPAGSGKSWIQAHNAPGCEPSVNLIQNGPGSGNGIGNGGGYGGFYCFALMP